MSDPRTRLSESLATLPTEEGGAMLVLATAGTPPAVALLSTGDVWIEGDQVFAVTYGGSSASRRLGGSFTLVVPAAGPEVLRVEVVDATARPAGELALLVGRLVDVRPTTEPPWRAELRFDRDPDVDTDVAGFLVYWRSVRRWLQSGCQGDPPVPMV